MHLRALSLASALLALACAPSPAPPSACGDCSSTQPAWHLFEAAPFNQFALPIAVDDDGVATLADISREGMVLRQLDPDGALLWERTWSGDVVNVRLSPAPSGHVHVAATIAARVELHTGEVRSAAESFVLLARLDERGELVWLRTSVGGQAWVDTATTLGQTLVVGGRVGGAVFLGGAMHEVGEHTTFIARYDDSGALLAERVLDGAGRGVAVLTALAVAPDTSVYATGQLIGDFDLGGGVRAGETGIPRFMVVAFDHGLNHRWDALLDADESGSGLALDADARGVVCSGNAERGSMLVRYDADGTERSRVALAERRVTAIHIEETGAIVVAGDVRPTGERPTGSLFVASFEESELLWERSWNEADGNIASLHRTPGGLVLSADFEGTVQLGDGARLVSDRRDALLLATYCACAEGD